MNKFDSILVFSVFAVLLVSTVSFSYADYLSPKKQLEQGVLPEEIQCRDDRVLVIRDNGDSACVRESTADKMNWEIIATEFTYGETKEENSETKTRHNTNSVDVESNIDDGDGLDLDITNSIFTADESEIIIVASRSDEPYDDEDIPYNGFSDTSPRRPSPLSYEEKIADGWREIFGPDEDGNITLDSVTLMRSPSHDLRIDIQDWIPTYLPAGQELKSIDWTRAEITEGTYESVHYWFAPTSSILNTTSTAYEFFDGHGIYIYVKKDIEIMSPERIAQYQSQFLEYGDVGMILNGTRAVAIDGDPEELLPSVIEYDNGPYHISIKSYRYHLDELTKMLNSAPKWSEWK